MASFWPPYTPVEPTSRVRTVQGNQHRPPDTLMISPNAKYRLPAERLPINQATGIGFVIRVVLNYFTLQNTGRYLIEIQAISLCFLIGIRTKAEIIVEAGMTGPAITFGWWYM